MAILTMRRVVPIIIAVCAHITAAIPISVNAKSNNVPVLPRHQDSKHHTTLEKMSTTTNTTALLQSLQTAITEEDRLNILVPSPSDATNLLHQFENNTVRLPTGGTIDLATVKNYPALLGTNVAMAVGFVNPCSLNTPHTHLRANEVLTVVQGSLVAAIIPENNPGSFGDVVDASSSVALTGPLPQINATLGLYQAILFPQGSVHWQFNPSCEPAVFVAAFDNNDPGRLELARALFSVQTDEVLNAALGGSNALSPKNIAKVRGMVPGSYAEIVEECAKTCGISIGSV